MNYKESYVGRVLNALSQLGNALINGNPDVSISARIGQENWFNKNKFYRFCGWVVDKTFYPVEGKDHCRNAYLNDRYEDFTVGKAWVYGEWLMVVILLTFCIPLSVLFWGCHGIKKIF